MSETSGEKPPSLLMYPTCRTAAEGFALDWVTAHPKYGPELTGALFATQKYPVDLDCFDADEVDFSTVCWFGRHGNIPADSSGLLVFRFYAYKDGSLYLATEEDKLLAASVRHCDPHEYSLVLGAEVPPYITAYSGVVSPDQTATRYVLSDADITKLTPILETLELLI